MGQSFFPPVPHMGSFKRTALYPIQSDCQFPVHVALGQRQGTDCSEDNLLHLGPGVTGRPLLATMSGTEDPKPSCEEGSCPAPTRLGESCADWETLELHAGPSLAPLGSASDPPRQ